MLPVDRRTSFDIVVSRQQMQGPSHASGLLGRALRSRSPRQEGKGDSHPDLDPGSDSALLAGCGGSGPGPTAAPATSTASVPDPSSVAPSSTPDRSTPV